MNTFSLMLLLLAGTAHGAVGGSKPAVRCQATFSLDVSAKSWTNVQDPMDLPQFEPTQPNRGGDVADPYFAISHERQRDANGDWVSTAKIAPLDKIRIYEHELDASGKCKPAKGRALTKGETITLNLTDDLVAGGPKTKAVKHCFSAETTADGVRIGVELKCTLEHSPARDAERTKDAQSKATGAAPAIDIKAPAAH